MTRFEYLDLEDLLGLTRALVAGPVRDIGLLEAACARPRATALGVEAYHSLELKAAALLHSLVRNRALVDGNKPLPKATSTLKRSPTGSPANTEPTPSCVAAGQLRGVVM